MSQTPDHDPARDARLADIASLGGEVALDGLLRRFAAQLAAQIEQPQWSADDAHRIVGLAGLLGFTQVEAAWRRIEGGEAPILPNQAAARDAALAAMAFIARRPSPPAVEP